MDTCKWHSCQKPAIRKFCSAACKNKFYVDARRRKIKQMALEYKGGQCEGCGYNRTATALQFHHLDPTQKEFALAKNGHTRSWDRVKAELDKCVLLCANCHAEVHEGLRIINKDGERGFEPPTFRIRACCTANCATPQCFNVRPSGQGMDENGWATF